MFGEFQGAFVLAAFKALHVGQRFRRQHGADVVVQFLPEGAELAVFGQRAVRLAICTFDQLRPAFDGFDHVQRGHVFRRARQLSKKYRLADG